MIWVRDYIVAPTHVLQGRERLPDVHRLILVCFCFFYYCYLAFPFSGRQIKLKDIIIKNFISEEQGQKMHAKAVWDDDIGDWIVDAESTIDLYSYKRPSVRYKVAVAELTVHGLHADTSAVSHLNAFLSHALCLRRHTQQPRTKRVRCHSPTLPTSSRNQIFELGNQSLVRVLGAQWFRVLCVGGGGALGVSCVSAHGIMNSPCSRLAMFCVAKYGRSRVGDNGRGQHFETKDGKQVLAWTTDIVRTANAIQLEMDPHQRTTSDYDEHHKQRQAQSALQMAMETDD